MPFLRHLALRRHTIEDPTAYPFDIPAVAGLDRLELHPAVTFLMGDNGSGKSTLIEAIALKAGFSAGGGTRNFHGPHRESESCLHEHLTLARGTTRERGGFFLRAETMYNLSTEAEAYASYGWEDLHAMSHGEAFLWVMLERFRPRGLYILDEPEAALSPQRQLSALARIHQLVQAGSQFVIATHSPILMAYPEAWIVSLDRDGLARIPYEDTDHYTLTRDFLNGPERMMRYLFDAVDD